MKRRKGFTIVELITVIVIISILATIAVVASNYVQRQARDNERKSDVLLLKNAIDKYHDNNGTYPLPASGCAVNNGCYVDLLIPILVPNYISSIPSSPTGSNYAYVRGTDAEDSYGVYVPMEVAAVCKTGSKMNTVWWGSVPSCSF